MLLFLHLTDFETVGEEGQVPIFWSQLWAAHHDQSSKQGVIELARGQACGTLVHAHMCIVCVYK